MRYKMEGGNIRVCYKVFCGYKVDYIEVFEGEEKALLKFRVKEIARRILLMLLCLLMAVLFVRFLFSLDFKTDNLVRLWLSIGFDLLLGLFFLAFFMMQVVPIVDLLKKPERIKIVDLKCEGLADKICGYLCKRGGVLLMILIIVSALILVGYILFFSGRPIRIGR